MNMTLRFGQNAIRLNGNNNNPHIARNSIDQSSGAQTAKNAW
jgi:hypothetical protein